MVGALHTSDRSGEDPGYRAPSGTDHPFMQQDLAPATEHRAKLVSVPCSMVRFLQAMAEDGHGAQPWRLGPGCCDQHVTGRTLSF